MLLWLSLRDRRLAGFKFVRQEAIDSFVVDFACRDRRLIVEVDGGQHADNPKDVLRDRRLAEAGYRILRFWNNDVLANKNGVLETILDALNK
jgi:very-short-patch-repair endonuclease